MSNILIIILLVLLIIKDYIPKKEIKKEIVQPKVDEKEEKLRKEFEGIMSYSIENAIDRYKRGE